MSIMKNKTFTKSVMMGALAVMVGVAGMASEGNADSRHHNNSKPHYNQPKDMFKRMDLNRDGLVTRKEFKKVFGNSRTAMRTFDRMDRNNSGKLGKNEVSNNQKLLRDLQWRA